jgi:hypothetical protein
MLYSYKMTNDSGFAPNPFYGVLTLATCKPKIRLLRGVGDYIAGFTSKNLRTSKGLCGDEVGQERLIYLMKVTEKLTIEQYYTDDRFQCKIPSYNSGLIAKTGDNIYEPDGKGDFTNISKYSHKGESSNEEIRHKEEMKHKIRDLSGKYVLISNDFYYFGSGAINVDDCGIKKPKVQSGYGVKSPDIAGLLEYLKEFKPNTVLNAPHLWKENEPFNL